MFASAFRQKLIEDHHERVAVRKRQTAERKTEIKILIAVSKNIHKKLVSTIELILTPSFDTDKH